MKKFIMIGAQFIYLFSNAGLLCENIYYNEVSSKPKLLQTMDKKALEKNLNELPELKNLDQANIKKSKKLINALIQNKMYHDADLAYSVVLYLYAHKYEFSKDFYKLIDRIVSHPTIYELLKSGSKMTFRNPNLNNLTAGVAKNENIYEWGTAYEFQNFAKPDSVYRIWISMVRPTKKFDLIAQANYLSRNIQARSFLNSTQSYAFTREVPSYNIFKALKVSLKKQLLGSKEIYQEVLLTEEPGTFRKRFVVISSHPIENADSNRFGVWFKALDFVGENGTDTTYDWKIEGHTFSAHITYKEIGHANIPIKDRESPNYGKMMMDGRLTGMIAVSNNLNDFSRPLTSEYYEYFVSEGFSLESSNNLTSKQAKDFILKTAEKSEIDYFIREGHLESANDTFIGLSEKMKLYKLVKGSGSKKVEVVYLVVPSTKKDRPMDEKISLTALGQALRNRQNQNPFIYFNAACHGHGTNPQIYRAVAAPGFTPIASDTLLTTFRPERGNVGYEFLHGLRSNATYRDMRDQIKRFGKDDETIVTPDQAGQYLEPGTTKNIEIKQFEIRRSF